jgi:hypothetical protein
VRDSDEAGEAVSSSESAVRSMICSAILARLPVWLKQALAQVALPPVPSQYAGCRAPLTQRIADSAL